MKMSWRLASRLSVITLALLVVVVVGLWGLRGGNSGLAAANQNSDTLQGTDLGSTLAPDFHLTDQAGKPIALSQFRGEPVILTFMYTRCPNVCPLAADKLHAVQLQLGKESSNVAMLAVSIDPLNDTQAAALTFSQEHKLTSGWHYLIGTQDELTPVWNAYNVYTQAASSTTSITHTEAIYVLDKQGRERVFLSDDFTTAELLSDLKILLSE